MIENGNIVQVCPRCGKYLEYRCGNNYEIMCCTDETCIRVYTEKINDDDCK